MYMHIEQEKMTASPSLVSLARFWPATLVPLHMLVATDTHTHTPFIAAVHNRNAPSAVI